MTQQEIDRIECAIRHIQTAVDVDPLAVEIAVEAMKTQLSAEGTTFDLISRAAAIDAVMDEFRRIPTSAIRAKTRIEALPPAQPEPCVNTIDALNESIKHFDDMAEECRRNANIERNDYMDMRDDAAEYRQLSIWLNELKWLRERFQLHPEIIRCKDCKHHWTHRCMDSMPTEICELDQTFYDANVDFCSLAERRTDE